MKSIVGWIPFALSGLSATAVLAEVPTTPTTLGHTPLFAAGDYAGIDETLFRSESSTGHLSEAHQREK